MFPFCPNTFTARCELHVLCKCRQSTPDGWDSESQSALRFDPIFPPPRHAGRAYADTRKACELTQWSDPGFIDSLAAAFAEHGDFANAVKLGERAVQMSANNPDVQQQLKSRVDSFRAGYPIRE